MSNPADYKHSITNIPIIQGGIIMSAKFQQRMENLLDEYFVANLPKLTSFLRENKYCEYNGPRVIPSAADYCNQFAPGHNMSREKQEKI